LIIRIVLLVVVGGCIAGWPPSTAAGALTPNDNQRPTATIGTPAAGTIYTAGRTLTYSGTGSDPETGNLPASAFTWRIDFHHADHIHPFMPATSGARSGKFTIPRLGETAANVWYRIHLKVEDSDGLAHEVYRDVLPRTATINLATQPSGLQLTIDKQPVATPYTTLGVTGALRSLGVVTPQTHNGITYHFRRWSNGGGATHSIITPGIDTTYTAQFTIPVYLPVAGK
jgi:hypothetical protein